MKERVTAREKKQKEEGENKGIMFPKENERPTNYSGRKKNIPQEIITVNI